MDKKSGAEIVFSFVESPELLSSWAVCARERPCPWRLHDCQACLSYMDKAMVSSKMREVRTAWVRNTSMMRCLMGDSRTSSQVLYLQSSERTDSLLVGGSVLYSFRMSCMYAVCRFCERFVRSLRIKRDDSGTKFGSTTHGYVPWFQIFVPYENNRHAECLLVEGSISYVIDASRCKE